MTPIGIAALLLELLKVFQASGRTPDQPVTDADLQAASQAAHVGLGNLQDAINAARKKPPPEDGA